MAKKDDPAKPSKWATKDGLQQVKNVLTRETMKKIKKMSANKKGDAVSEVVQQLDNSSQGSFISQNVEQQEQVEKPSLVKCKEGQDEVFDNCVKDDSPSKEQVEDQE